MCIRDRVGSRALGRLEGCPLTVPCPLPELGSAGRHRPDFRHLASTSVGSRRVGSRRELHLGTHLDVFCRRNRVQHHVLEAASSQSVEVRGARRERSVGASCWHAEGQSGLPLPDRFGGGSPCGRRFRGIGPDVSRRTSNARELLAPLASRRPTTVARGVRRRDWSASPTRAHCLTNFAEKSETLS